MTKMPENQAGLPHIVTGYRAGYLKLGQRRVKVGRAIELLEFGNKIFCSPPAYIPSGVKKNVVGTVWDAL